MVESRLNVLKNALLEVIPPKQGKNDLLGLSVEEVVRKLWEGGVECTDNRHLCEAINDLVQQGKVCIEAFSYSSNQSKDQLLRLFLNQ